MMPVSYPQLCHTDPQVKTSGTAKSGALPFGKGPQAVLSLWLAHWLLNHMVLLSTPGDFLRHLHWPPWCVYFLPFPFLWLYVSGLEKGTVCQSTYPCFSLKKDHMLCLLRETALWKVVGTLWFKKIRIQGPFAFTCDWRVHLGRFLLGCLPFIYFLQDIEYIF